MNEQNLAKLERELEAQKQAYETAKRKMAEVEQAKRKAEQLAKEAERAAANKKQYEAFTVHADKIIAEIKKLGYEVTYKAPDLKWQVYPIFDIRSIHFSTMGSTNYYSRSGKPAVRIDTIETTKTYPLKKDGTFSYEKIAKAWVDAIKQREAVDKRRNDERERYQVNGELRKHVLNELGLDDYSSKVQRSKYHNNRVDVNLNIGNLTGEAAIELLKAVKNLGIEIR